MGDVVANVTQLEYSNNKYYALTFRDIYIYIISICCGFL